MKKKSISTAEYVAFVTDLKSRILAARLSSAKAVNRDLILLYWDIGQAIIAKQSRHGWRLRQACRVTRSLSEGIRRPAPACRLPVSLSSRRTARLPGKGARLAGGGGDLAAG